jgi:hypothetical protein
VAKQMCGPGSASDLLAPTSICLKAPPLPPSGWPPAVKTHRMTWIPAAVCGQSKYRLDSFTDAMVTAGHRKKSGHSCQGLCGRRSRGTFNVVVAGCATTKNGTRASHNCLRV